MVKTRSLDAAAQAANHAAVSMEKIYKEEMAQCTAILRRHPQARAPCLRWLTSAGFTLESQPLSLTKSNQTLGKERSQATRLASAKAEKEHVVAGGSGGMVPSKYNSLSALSYTLLSERILPSLDAVSLSSANIHVAMKPIEDSRLEAK